MRNLGLACFFTMALLLPRVAPAQVIQYRTPLPEVTAAYAPWQIAADPIVVQGLIYYPTRETRMFDGAVMTQVDVYEGVPVYADPTREPFTLVYVPLTRFNLRTYERAADPGVPVISGRGRPMAQAVPTAGVTEPEGEIETPIATTLSRGAVLESIPPPRENGGVWIPFNGQRWYSDGAAVSYAADRFVQIGTYYDFPVFKDTMGAADRILVPAVIGGPLTPYKASPR